MDLGPPVRLFRRVPLRVPLAVLAFPQERLRLFQISRPGKLKKLANPASTQSLSVSLQAFSVFFVCIAVTSDMICYLFIPVHWLFFAASTYVWVQYVWHTGELDDSTKSTDGSSRAQNLTGDDSHCRKRRVRTDCLFVAAIRLHRSGDTSSRIQGSRGHKAVAPPSRSLQAVCGPLVSSNEHPSWCTRS